MMKKTVFFAFVVLFMFQAPSYCETWTGNINLLLGEKELDENDWEPVEDHSEFGVAFDIKKESWPVSFTIEYLSSEGTEEEEVFISGLGYFDVEYEGTTTELALGIRGIFELTPMFSVFIAGGFLKVDAEAKVTIDNISVSEEEDGNGHWYSIGFFLTLAEHLNLGAQLRWSEAEVEVNGYDAEVGGQHTLFLVGYHW
jgi:hypothetical protein